MSKYTRFSRTVFKFCDILCQPLSNWWRQNTKGLTAKLDVPYGTETCQKADIYYKAELADVKKPVFMNIHGGGFVGGDKSVRNALSIWYAKLGYFVFNINYGLAPEKMFPEGPRDCIMAYNWLVDNAEAYNLDTSRIVVGGDSSGGYLSAVVAATSYSKELQNFYGIATKVKPCAVVLNCGIYDVKTVLSSKMIFNMAPKLALDFCGIATDEIEKYEHRDYLSVIDYITDEFPPSFVAYAKKDIFVPGQGNRLIEKLQNFGVYEEHYEAKRFGDNHVFPLFWDAPSAKECNAQIKEFLIKKAAYENVMSEAN
ncbi:MAG TPA: alpha/beta hydrolase [Clostridia bacterium]|nr:alpha/beta hydrolase [Clostridia bacterium]